jgi:hypothetical protein
MAKLSMSMAKLSMSRRSDWPRIRADLEQQLTQVIKQFIATGSFDSAALRAFAKKISSVDRDLAHLDAKESELRAIHGR